ncbi:MAG: tRNA(Ile)(2)-agmatinylcytidine synthase [Euryarchaeota archaeon]|nr:tRNA(Ile)(2)-agmatinylcytidine synthase [Euryarchaeota archaeon]
MFIGIDDTDSKEGMCTTYLAKRIIDKIGCREYPRLIRLNPNIPYKTRGNGALSMVTDGPKDEALELFMKYSHHKKENTNPGIVFMDEIPPSLKKFALRALHENIEIKEALNYIEKNKIDHFALGNKRGLIGALSSVGMVLNDHTYELIAYRGPLKFRKKREVDVESVIEMDKRYYPRIFDNYDYTNEYLCIAPHSPCPVLYGLRGEDPDLLEEAHRMIRSEKVERKQIFLTNQGTDMHLVRKEISNIQEYESVIVRGTVSEPPGTIEGGHVIFKVDECFCAAYEPTKEFRRIIRKLIVGDYVEAYGGVKDTKGLTINLEKIAVLELAPQYAVKKEKCSCGGTFKSRGGGLYRCKDCGKERRFKKTEVKRDIAKGLYEVPPIARRHLAKPLCRY